MQLASSRYPYIRQRLWKCRKWPHVEAHEDHCPPLQAWMHWRFTPLTKTTICSCIPELHQCGCTWYKHSWSGGLRTLHIHRIKHIPYTYTHTHAHTHAHTHTHKHNIHILMHIPKHGHIHIHMQIHSSLYNTTHVSNPKNQMWHHVDPGSLCECTELDTAI